jgi:hypothetical protein
VVLQWLSSSRQIICSCLSWEAWSEVLRRRSIFFVLRKFLEDDAVCLWNGVGGELRGSFEDIHVMLSSKLSCTSQASSKHTKLKLEPFHNSLFDQWTYLVFLWFLIITCTFQCLLSVLFRSFLVSFAFLHIPKSVSLKSFFLTHRHCERDGEEKD